MGELGEIITGSTPKTSDDRNYSSDDYCFVKPSDFNNSIKELYKSEFFISEFAYNNSRKLPVNSVLVTCIGNIGNIAINKIECTTNQQINSIIPYEGINSKFLAYSVFAKKDYLQFIANAPVVPILNKTNFSNVEIPIPPLPIQKAIVKELDVLHRLKELQEQQLVEYDNLAQSTFYSMFGDPIDNEKGWEVRRLVEVAPVNSFKGNVQKFNNKFWLLNLDAVEQQSGQILSVNLVEESEINQSTVKFNEDNVLYSKLRPYLNKVVIPHTSGYCTSELLPLLPQKDLLNRLFFTLLLRSQSFVQYIQEKTNGAKMPRVNMDEFRSFKLIIPPLSLQTAFAERIEKIEAQKELIKQGITETQLLIDYSMDKYFG